MPQEPPEDHVADTEASRKAKEGIRAAGPKALIWLDTWDLLLILLLAALCWVIWGKLLSPYGSQLLYLYHLQTKYNTAEPSQISHAVFHILRKSFHYSWSKYEELYNPEKGRLGQKLAIAFCLPNSILLEN